MIDDTDTGHRRLWVVALLAVVLFTVLGTPPPAWAHNALVSTSPEDGKTMVKPPTSVVLTFNEPAIASGTRVLVTGPNGSVAAGDPKLVDSTVQQALQPELPAGEYRVEWRVTSADGHPINGVFSFAVRSGTVPVSTPTPVPTTDDPGSPPAPSPAQTASDLPTTVASPSGVPADPAPGPRSGWWWLLAVVPVCLAAVLGWRFNRRH